MPPSPLESSKLSRDDTITAAKAVRIVFAFIALSTDSLILGVLVLGP
jgi:hypothetical protein